MHSVVRLHATLYMSVHPPGPLPLLSQNGKKHDEGMQYESNYSVLGIDTLPLCCAPAQDE